MSRQKKARRVDAAELRDLGFPENLIQEAVLREERGLLAVEPPADLVERTIQACADLFPEEKSSEPANYFSWVLQLVSAVGVRDLSLAFEGAAAAVQCQTLGEVPRQLAESLRFALSERQSPLVVLENHNLTSPVSWEDNAESQKIKMGFDRLNDFLSSAGIERSAVLVVLRPNIDDYSPEEINAIGNLTREATSDIWWVPMSRAVKYAQEDGVVIGNEKVLKIHGQSIAFCDDAVRASQLRREISDELRPCGTQIKIHGQLHPAVARALRDPEGIKFALERVIEGRPLGIARSA